MKIELEYKKRPVDDNSICDKIIVDANKVKKLKEQKVRTVIDKTIDSFIRQGIDTETIVNYLAEHLTAKEMSEELAKSLKENQRLRDNMPVVMRISQEDFDRHFRIIGTRADGKEETRGRRRKEA